MFSKPVSSLKRVNVGLRQCIAVSLVQFRALDKREYLRLYSIIVLLQCMRVFCVYAVIHTEYHTFLII